MDQPQKPSPRRLSPGSSPRPATPSPPAPKDGDLVGQHKRLRSLQRELSKESKNQLLAVPEPTSPSRESVVNSAPNTTRNRKLRPPKLNIKLKEQRDLLIDDENKEEDLEMEELLIEFCNSCCKSEKEKGKMINVSDLSLYLRGQIPQFIQQFGK